MTRPEVGDIYAVVGVAEIVDVVIILEGGWGQLADELDDDAAEAGRPL